MRGSATGGRYFRANDLEELDRVYAELDELEPLDFETFSYRPRYELYQWFVGAYVLLILVYHLSMGAWSPLRQRRSRKAATGQNPAAMEGSVP